MDKALSHISNTIVVLVMGALMAYMIYQVPNSEWVGNILSAGMGAMAGYLRGVSSSKSKTT